jgi:hypothetical protein
MEIRRGLMAQMTSCKLINLVKNAPLHDGYINASGGIGNQSAAKEVYTDFIDKSLWQAGDTVFAVFKSATNVVNWCCIAIWDSEGAFIKRVADGGGTSTSWLFDGTNYLYSVQFFIPDNAANIRFSWRTYDGGIYKAFVPRSSLIAVAPLV